ncbi:MAG: prolipoprotein diacylglyceryl transferase [Firmicutes bacterium]|nr:prolipoprotein diacylglyceryl transferase [Bacillota bacterium]
MPEVWFPNLGITIDKLDNVAVTIFGIDLYWYGIIIGCGLILGFLLAYFTAKKLGYNADLYIDFIIVAIIACVISARLYYVIFSWDQYKDNLWKIFAIREGGLAIYGAVIAAVITAYVFCKRKKLNFWAFTDIAMIGLPLGQAIGRWGNFINKEAFGGFTEGLFAMRYMKDTVRGIPQAVAENILTIEGVEYIQVHPTFLYESMWNFALVILMLIMVKRKKFDGQLIATYFLGYGIGRFWIEGLRTDQLIIGSTGIAVSQVVSLILIALGIAICIIRRNKEKVNRLELEE